MAMQFPPALAPLLTEQGRVNGLGGQLLADYLLASKDRVPPSTPFAAGHGDPDAHGPLHNHVRTIVSSLIHYQKLHQSNEGRALILIGGLFTGAASITWETCSQTEQEVPQGTGIGETSSVYRALRAMLRLYSDPMAHDTMSSKLDKLVWDPRGVSFSRATFERMVLEYNKVAAATVNLDAPLQLPAKDWPAWLAEFKKRLPTWALKIMAERPASFGSPAAFWNTLAAAEPMRQGATARTGVRALTDFDLSEEYVYVPWREAALSAFQAGNIRLGQACLAADGNEDELPPVSPASLLAMSRGAPLMARNNKPLECWTCGGNHIRANCDGSGPRAQGAAGTHNRIDARPPHAPALLHRPGFNATGQTYVTSIAGSPAGGDADLRASVHDLTLAVQAQGEHFQSVLAALTSPPSGLLQLADIHAQAPGATAAPGGPPVMVSATAPEGYVQVGRSNLAGTGEEVPVWASEAALRQSSENE